MRTVSSKKMKLLDSLATRRFGIPSLILMENAGRSAADEALKMFAKKGIRRVAVFCGYGNNGGDGFVCGRHLINKGVFVNFYLVGKRKIFSKETKLNFEILQKMGKKFKAIKASKEINDIRNEIGRYDLIVDAIFGIGLRGRLDTFYELLFEKLNAVKIPILALDIPSGLDADTGNSLGKAVKARRTVTFGMVKKGLTRRNAKLYAGKVVFGDISLPKNVLL
jgi:hydroxyethylthiazole kinase-like uncharacterized protein yjeF